jgi:hypothetical protein
MGIVQRRRGLLEGGPLTAFGDRGQKRLDIRRDRSAVVEDHDPVDMGRKAGARGDAGSARRRHLDPTAARCADASAMTLPPSSAHRPSASSASARAASRSDRNGSADAPPASTESVAGSPVWLTHRAPQRQHVSS